MDIRELLSQHIANDLDSYELDHASDITLEEISETIQQMQEDSRAESKRNQRRFTVQTVIALLALVASVIAALASLIALFP